MTRISGECLCGTVRFELETDFSAFHLCHCTQCQKATGSAHASNLFTDAANIRWLAGEEQVRRYDVPGRQLTNAFCGTCGAAVPYLSKSGKALVVPSGSLNAAPGITPQDNIFWSERASWYDEGLSAPRFDGCPE